MGIIILVTKGCGIEEFKDYISKKNILFSIFSETQGVDDILSEVNIKDLVIAEYTQSLSSGLENKKIDYDLFYPCQSRKIEIIEEMVKKKVPYIDISKFDKSFYDDIEVISRNKSEFCHKHEMVNLGEKILNNKQLINYIEDVAARAESVE